MSNCDNYGKYYCSDISPDGEIYLFADRVEYWISEVVEDWEVWNPELVAEYKKKHGLDRNGKVNGNNNHHPERDKMTQSLRLEVMRRDDFHCVKCKRGNGDNVKLEVDHIVPVSKGGKTVLDNLQTLCFDCNRGKRDKVDA